MNIKFIKSIGFKMTLGLVIGLFIIISISSQTNIMISEKRVLTMAEREASKMSNAIKGSLEEAMLSGDTGKIQAIVDAVAKESMIEDIKILSADGRIKVAKNKSEIGTQLDIKKMKSCGLCHGGAAVKKDNLTVIFRNENDERILRNANPLYNKKECHSCHGSESRVLGKLLVDFSFNDAGKAVSESRMILVISAAATLLSAVIIVMILFAKFVKSPLNQLISNMDRVEKGNWETFVKVKGEDEIARLNEKFSDMVSAVRASEQQVKEQMDELLALVNVSEILNRTDSIDEAVELLLNTINIGFSVEESTVMLNDESGRFILKNFVGVSGLQAQTLVDYIGTSDIKSRIAEGELFIAVGIEKAIGDFLVVPLKSAKRLIGVITVHKIKGKEIKDIENIDAIKRLFLIIAAQMSPYLFIGQSMDEKRTMQTSPFGCFLDLIKGRFDMVKEYSGNVSLAVIKVENYNSLCKTMGVDNASCRVQEVGAVISSAIDNVHDATRITEIKLVVILPMVDKMEAMDIIDRAITGVGDDVVLKYKVVSYPEDGDTPAQLMFLAYV